MKQKQFSQKIMTMLLVFAMMLQVLVPVGASANDVEATDELYQVGIETEDMLGVDDVLNPSENEPDAGEEASESVMDSSEEEPESMTEPDEGESLVIPLSNEEISIYITFEGYNLGQGFYIEPTELTLPEGATAEDATRVLLDQKGHGFTSSGSGASFFLDRVQGFDTGVVNPPPFITETLGAGSNDGSLGSFDYTFSSGWMITVNHDIISTSAGAHLLNDQDVIRWQFSIQGFGADLGIDSGWGQPLLYTHANKTELIQGLFTYEISANLRQEALDVIIEPLATEDEVIAVLTTMRGLNGGEPAPDFVPLMRAIDQADQLYEWLHTPESWSALQIELATARALVDDPYTNQEIVDAATENVLTAINELELLIAENETVIRVTSGANLGVFEKGARHFAPFIGNFELTLEPALAHDAYDVYTVVLPRNRALHAQAYIAGETALQARRFNLSEGGTIITMDLTPLSAWEVEDNGFMNASMMTNLDDTGALNLNVGESFDLDTFRVWQAMLGVTNNYFIEPNFNFEVFGDHIDIEHIGEPGREQLRITATENGVAVIKVTYDPVELYELNGQLLRFNGIDERNTVAVVVNVNGGSEIDTGITMRNDFDVAYFDREVGYRKFMFTPELGSTVRVHDPLTISPWGSGWSSYTADEAGGFTVSLSEGANIIEVRNGASLRHHVVTAHGVDVVVENLTNPGEDFVVGDRARVSLQGMSTPIEKLAGIYNPGVPGFFGAPDLRPFISYTDGDITNQSARRGQYSTLMDTFIVEHTLTDPQLNVLNGHIHIGVMGSQVGTHRHIPLNGVPQNLNALPHGPYPFGMLPEIELPIASPSPVMRQVTVTGGTVVGGATHEVGQNVTINAIIPANHRFVRWENVGSTTIITNANRTNQSITFTMPASNVTVRAVTERIPRTLTVTGGTGGGTVGQGASRTIRANAPRAGYRFDRWTTSTPGVSFTNARSATTAIVMPARNATVRAVFVRRTAANPRVTMRRPGVLRNNVALHRGPGTTYHLNRNLRQGQQITVLNSGRNGWRFVQVGTSNVRGWVRTNQITHTTTLGTVRARRIPMRAGANSGRTIMHLNRNANIIILGTNSNRSWTQVHVGRRTGWVRTSQIRTVTPSARTRGQLQLRQGPGTSFARSSNNRVNRNARVVITGRQGNWSRIRIGNRTGWVRTNQLR